MKKITSPRRVKFFYPPDAFVSFFFQFEHFSRISAELNVGISEVREIDMTRRDLFIMPSVSRFFSSFRSATYRPYETLNIFLPTIPHVFPRAFSLISECRFSLEYICRRSRANSISRNSRFLDVLPVLKNPRGKLKGAATSSTSHPRGPGDLTSSVID